jgi:hypothetical protein
MNGKTIQVTIMSLKPGFEDLLIPELAHVIEASGRGLLIQAETARRSQRSGCGRISTLTLADTGVVCCYL